MDESFGIAIFSLIVFLFSTVCHEAAHAVSALYLGDKTAYHNGQVTLNPVPHIRQEPFGLGILPLISLLQNMRTGDVWIFGFASAPFDPHWGMRNPKKAAWMRATVSVSNRPDTLVWSSKPSLSWGSMRATVLGQRLREPSAFGCRSLRMKGQVSAFPEHFFDVVVSKSQRSLNTCGSPWNRLCARWYSVVLSSGWLLGSRRRSA